MDRARVVVDAVVGVAVACWVLAESYVRLKLLPQRRLCFLHDTHVESPTRPNQRNATTDRRDRAGGPRPGTATGGPERVCMIE